MKRFLIWMLCVVMVLCLAACGEKATSETADAAKKGNQAQVQDAKPTDNAATEPQATEPQVTEPQPTEPQPTEPQPTEPQPTEPQPTEPKPTEPKPTEPKPTEPKPTHSHSYQTVVVEGTCKAEGYMRSQCSCGHILSEAKLPMMSHNWKAASCAAPKTCSTCGATEGVALEHDWMEANYNRPKTCRKCKATEGAALKAPDVRVKDSFPKSYNYYSRSFTVNSCEAKFAQVDSSLYIKISMNVTRTTDSTPTAGKLAFKVNIYDATGALVKQDSISSAQLEQNTTGVMSASIPLPKNSQSDSYSISFTESY